MKFFKNGVDQGVAFTAFESTTYFPAISLYMGGRVRVNFGPTFVFPPPAELRSKPISSLRPLPKEENKIHAQRIKEQRIELGLCPPPQTASSSSGQNSVDGPVSGAGGGDRAGEGRVTDRGGDSGFVGGEGDGVRAGACGVMGKGSPGQGTTAGGMGGAGDVARMGVEKKGV
ncbi:unnamed protein product [Discosporangium mesarthrocarpum]